MNGKNITYIASLVIFVIIIVYLIYRYTKGEYSTVTDFYESLISEYTKFPSDDEDNQYFYINSDNDIYKTSVYDAFYFPIMYGLDKIEKKIWNDISSNILSIISDDDKYKLLTKIKNQYNDKTNSDRVSFLSDNNTYMGSIKRTFITYDTLLKIEMRYGTNGRAVLIKAGDNGLWTRSGSNSNAPEGVWDRWYFQRYPK